MYAHFHSKRLSERVICGTCVILRRLSEVASHGRGKTGTMTAPTEILGSFNRPRSLITGQSDAEHILKTDYNYLEHRKKVHYSKMVQSLHGLQFFVKTRFRYSKYRL
jgi:hypothetical protein